MSLRMLYLVVVRLARLAGPARPVAATGIDDWAKADALPSEEEITRIRRLIARISAGLGQLTAAERAQFDQAITNVRRHRVTTLGIPAPCAVPKPVRKR